MTVFYILRHSERSEESPRRTDGAYTCSLKSWDISLTLNMTYFFCFPRSRKRGLFFVFASMSSEQTCLQGFASDDIHKALAFLIKNAENESFNAQALSAE